MNLLVTGAFPLTDERRRVLEEDGFTVFYQQDEREKTVDPRRFEAVICNGLFLYQDWRDFTNLKMVQLTSAGLDRIAADDMRQSGIRIFNASGVYSVPMAEWAVGGILALYRGEPFFWKNQQRRQWEKNRSLREVYGKQALICGCGSVGAAIANRLMAFGCRVQGIDRSPEKSLPFVVFPVEKTEELLPQADLVVLSLPLTEETVHFLDRRRLSQMKRDAVLVNCARGALVDEKALIDTLRQGRLFGCVLDVFAEEPLAQDSPLWTFDRVLISPHNSFVGEGNGQRLFDLIRKNLSAREKTV